MELLIKLAVMSFLIYALITSLDLFTEKLRVNLSAKVQYGLNEEAFRHLMKVRPVNIQSHVNGCEYGYYQYVYYKRALSAACSSGCHIIALTFYSSIA